MKSLHFTALAFAGLSLASAPAFAQTFQAYDNTGSARGSAGGNLNIGHEFVVSGSGITVDDLGVYNDATNSATGLVSAHDVTLFQISNLGQNPTTTTPLVTVNVPGGTAAPLVNGFRFEPITPLTLAPGNYAVIAYGMNATGGDPYGDGGGLPDGVATPNVTDFRFDPFQFTNNTSPAFPNAGDSGNHASASIEYTVGAVPEPSTWIAASGLLLLAAGDFRRRLKA